jgi:GcrA cell cycle regulator
MMGVVTWSPDRVQQLRDLFEQGCSCRQIAAKLGGVSRNAVIGKLTRLGLTDRARARPLKPATAPKQKTVRAPRLRIAANNAPTSAKTAVPPAQVNVSIDIAATRISLLDARKDQCRWPAADDGSAAMVCGAATCGGSYCASHSWLSVRGIAAA